MFEGYRESEILEYIEDELEPRRRAALEDRLAGDAEVRALVDRLRSDRAVLLAVETPELPADLLASLESRFARPLLLERTPGEYRRRHNRGRVAAARLRRVAIAAGVLVTVSAGTWVAVGLLSALPAAEDRSADEVVAGADGVGGVGGAGGETTVAVARTEPGDGLGPPLADELIFDGVVHHGRPLAPFDAGTAVAAGSADADDGGPAMHAADLAVVVTMTDVPTAETALAGLVDRFGRTSGDDDDATTSATFVRNFSFEEARILLERETGAGATEPVFAQARAALDGGLRTRSIEERRSRRTAAADLLREVQRRRMKEEAATFRSRRIAGPDHLAPSYERQLEFASRGAAHAITVPRAELAAFLADLSSLPGVSTRFRTLPGAGNEVAPGDADSGASGLVRWMRDVEHLRTLLRQIDENAAGRDDVYVVLPVVIETVEPSAGRRGR